ncbi:DUF397 domain-containing protein [Streptomonospora algeriensis]|uniref:DUF397 domain-containing protein n=1 Tax=Streptomonospora algeriensis TaxID=995084 RepID=A0ABW3BC74_9ACTN
MDLPTEPRLRRLPESDCGGATGVNRVHAASDASTVRFRKSSYSFKENCVEVANDRGAGVAVRDSADTAAGHLAFSPAAWAALLGLVKAGRL